MEAGGGAGPAAPLSRRRLGLTASGADGAGFRRALLEWAETGLRPLPWRETRDPWWVLVSEVMLQQTQADRVVPFWHAFVQRFPTPASCAAARRAEVVRLWGGLGYNRRAVMVHRTAEMVVDRHHGSVPADLGALLALPGVGPYTARAVLAFAFEQPVAVVDVNVARVLARAVAGSPLSAATAQELADRQAPDTSAWAWNQALLDVGARFCVARRPRCGGCPVAEVCAWTVDGRPAPDPAARRTAPQPFEGSDREGRGRLVHALRQGPLALEEWAAAAGWPEDPARAARIVDRLVTDGLVCRTPDGRLALA